MHYLFSFSASLISRSSNTSSEGFGGSGAGASSFFFNLFIAFTTQNRTNATIRKFTIA